MGATHTKRMSALGQKQTLAHIGVMSALPPKADIGTHSCDVRFVPKADITGKREPPVGMVFPTYLLLPARSCSTAWSSVKLPGR